jgi:hypothetical protein
MERPLRSSMVNSIVFLDTDTSYTCNHTQSRAPYSFDIGLNSLTTPPSHTPWLGKPRLVTQVSYILRLFLPCYESLIHLTSPQRSSLRSYIFTLYYLLGASHGLLFPYYYLWRLRRSEAFPEENVFRGYLVELHNAALNLWKVERRLPL